MKIISVISKKHGTYNFMVDDEDYEYLNQFNWGIIIAPNGRVYARRYKYPKGKTKSFSMHREIMRCNNCDGNIIDHSDGNTLNNQKSNLRTCNPSQNGANRKSYGISKYL